MKSDLLVSIPHNIIIYRLELSVNELVQCLPKSSEQKGPRQRPYQPDSIPTHELSRTENPVTEPMPLLRTRPEPMSSKVGL